MDVEWIQIPVLFMLFFVLLYGIGFIFNMLLKTTWLPIYAYLIVIIPWVIYWQWDSELSMAGNLSSFGLVDYLTAIAGIIGAYASGRTIRFLREKGYKMF